MREKVRKSLSLGVLLGVLAVLFACRDPFAGSLATGTGTMQLAFPLSRGLDTDVMLWHVSGTGPGAAIDRVFTASNTTVTLPDLALGAWTITVDGLDNRQQIACSATQTITVLTGDNTAEFQTKLVDGRLIDRWNFDSDIKDSMRRHNLLEASDCLAVGNGFAPSRTVSTPLADGASFLSFSGTSSGSLRSNGGYLQLGALDFGDHFTISMWVNPRPLAGAYTEARQVLFSNQDPAVEPVNGVSVGSGFTIAMNTWNSGNGASPYFGDRKIIIETANGSVASAPVVSDASFDGNAWQLLTVCFDRASATVSLTLNDYPAGHGAIRSDFATSGQMVRVGGLPAGDGTRDGYFFKGYIDDLRVMCGWLDGHSLVASQYFAGGDGTPGKPYQVASAEQLNKVRFFTKSSFVQTANIDFSTTPWLSSVAYGVNFAPIGNKTLGGDYPAFRGSYNGNSWGISGLYANSGNNNVGLFGEVAGASISNVVLLSPAITGQNYVGALVGSADVNPDTLVPSLISNCRVVGGSVSGISQVGGLVGCLTDSQVTNCVANTSFNGSSTSIVGGLIGKVLSDTLQSKVTSSSASSTFSGCSSVVGGLVGQSNGEISDCSSSGSVSALGASTVGGLVGELDGGTTFGGKILRSYALSTVSGNNQVGGLVGAMVPDTSAPMVSQSYFNGFVNGSSDDTGGLVGTSNGTVEDCYAMGTIMGSSNSGGLIGRMTSTTTAIRSWASVSGSIIHGLVGAVAGETVTTCYWDGAISNSVAPLVGATYGHTLEMGTTAFYDPSMFTGAWKINAGSTYPYLAWQGSTHLPYLPLGNLNIYFSPLDPEMAFPIGVISKSGGTQTVYGPSFGFSNYEWYLNDTFISSGSSYIVSLSGLQLSALAFGYNNLTVIVTSSADGRQYSHTVSFFVSN